jgi:hypothetical protein
MNGFKEHLNLCETSVGMTAALAFLAKDVGADRLHLDPDEILKGRPVKGRIEFISERENPILILLSDGSRLYFPYDALKKVSGCRPEKGRWMEALIQTFAKDFKQLPKVQWAVCY